MYKSLQENEYERDKHRRTSAVLIAELCRAGRCPVENRIFLLYLWYNSLFETIPS
jgi:hypothetical protein